MKKKNPVLETMMKAKQMTLMLSSFFQNPIALRCIFAGTAEQSLQPLKSIRTKILMLFVFMLLGSSLSLRAQTETTLTKSSNLVNIPDNNASGANAQVSFSGIPTDAILSDIEVSLGINHQNVGDLIIKLIAPTGDEITLVDRPARNNFGDYENANLVSTHPISFSDAYTGNPELMGTIPALDTHGEICKDDGNCTFLPNDDTANRKTFADLMAEVNANGGPSGSWRVNISDRAGNNSGNFRISELRLTYLQYQGCNPVDKISQLEGTTGHNTHLEGNISRLGNSFIPDCNGRIANLKVFTGDLIQLGMDILFSIQVQVHLYKDPFGTPTLMASSEPILIDRFSTGENLEIIFDTPQDVLGGEVYAFQIENLNSNEYRLEMLFAINTNPYPAGEVVIGESFLTSPALENWDMKFEVNYIEYACAIDTDNDGVVDCNDQEPNSLCPEDVNADGVSGDRDNNGTPDCQETLTLHVDADAALGGDGYSWGNAFKYLQDALYLANTFNGDFAGIEIWVAQGVYYPDQDEGGNVTDNDSKATFNLLEGVGVYGGFRGDELARTERDPETYTTILSGDIDDNDTNEENFVMADVENDIVGNNSNNVVFARNLTVAATMDGFTITAGNATAGSTTGYRYGGGVFVGNATIILRNLTFIANRATYEGGGLWVGYLPYPTPEGEFYKLSNLTFIRNKARDGGGLYTSYGGFSIGEVSDLKFIKNIASNEGGGMYLYASPGSYDNIEFIENSAKLGGGAHLDDAIYFRNSTFTKNNATLAGGGLHISGTLSGTTNCLFYGNTAGNGAAIKSGAKATCTYTNTTFHANIATNSGAVLYISGDDSQAKYTFTNCLVSGNTANEIPNAFGPSSTLALGNYDISYSYFDVASLPASFNDLDGNLFNQVDPFVDAENGNFQLTDYSNAIDAGNNGANTTTIDIAGNARKYNDLGVADTGAGTAPLIDMGAFERQTDSEPCDDSDNDGVCNEDDQCPGINDAILPIDPGTIAFSDGSTALSLCKGQSFSIIEVSTGSLIDYSRTAIIGFLENGNALYYSPTGFPRTDVPIPANYEGEIYFYKYIYGDDIGVANSPTDIEGCHYISDEFLTLTVVGDTDNDGVCDNLDQEINSPCPEDVDINGISNDDDGDGVPNCNDVCNGAADTDNDGVCNEDDQCSGIDDKILDTIDTGSITFDDGSTELTACFGEGTTFSVIEASTPTLPDQTRVIIYNEQNGSWIYTSAEYLGSTISVDASFSTLGTYTFYWITLGDDVDTNSQGELVGCYFLSEAITLTVVGDSDNDGVCDAIDQEIDSPCPSDVDANGVSNDEDGDGVPNCNDVCDGAADTDNDGVCNEDDQCPGIDDKILDTIDAGTITFGDGSTVLTACLGEGTTFSVIEANTPTLPDQTRVIIYNEQNSSWIYTSANYLGTEISVDASFFNPGIYTFYNLTISDNTDENNAGEITGCYFLSETSITLTIYGDTDNDGVCDEIDQEINSPCPADIDANGVSNDDDGDGVANCEDACEGADDATDSDADSIPDDCDVCDGGDDSADADADSVPDACDVCEGIDDNIGAGQSTKTWTGAVNDNWANPCNWRPIGVPTPSDQVIYDSNHGKNIRIYAGTDAEANSIELRNKVTFTVSDGASLTLNRHLRARTWGGARTPLQLLHNHGTINIGQNLISPYFSSAFSVSGDELNCKVTNFESGIINIDNCQQGIRLGANTSGFCSFDNRGEIYIGQNGGASSIVDRSIQLDTEANAFKNSGKIYLWDNLSLPNARIGEDEDELPFYNDEGLLYVNTAQTSSNLGKLANYGVVVAVQGGFDEIINRALLISPIAGDCQIEDAIQIGNSNDYTVLDEWFYDRELTNKSGDYDQTSNTFSLTQFESTVSTLYMTASSGSTSYDVSIELTLDAVTDVDLDGVVDCFDQELASPCPNDVDVNGVSNDEDDDGTPNCVDECPSVDTDEDGGAIGIEINPGETATSALYCIGAPALENISLVFTQVPNPINWTFFITDANGDIITNQSAATFNFSDYPAGLYLISYITYNDGTSVFEENINDIEGCFAISNPVTLEIQNVDEDGDGVLDCEDQELNSPCPDDVDANGVSNDDDGDGTPNCTDDCDDTIDADNDGVADCVDQELGSPCPDDVDANGVSNDDDGDGTPNCTDDCDDTIDADNDGVADCIDQELDSPCPDDVDENGVSNDDDGDGTPNCTDDCDDTIDTDNDGVADCVDQELNSPCPDDVDANGVSNDDDGDGTPNCTDDCDDTIDDDNDGVADCVDQELNSPCPDDVDANGVSNDDDGDGTPNCSDDCDDTIDDDNDGVADCVDQELGSPCPDDVDANGVSNDDDGDGTPNCTDDCDDTIDTDNDGVADCVDSCPTIAGDLDGGEFRFQNTAGEIRNNTEICLGSPSSPTLTYVELTPPSPGLNGIIFITNTAGDLISSQVSTILDFTSYPAGGYLVTYVSYIDGVDVNVANINELAGCYVLSPQNFIFIQDIDEDGDGVQDCVDQESNSPCPADVDANGISRDDDNDGTPNCEDTCPSISGDIQAGVLTSSTGTDNPITSYSTCLGSADAAAIQVEFATDPTPGVNGIYLIIDNSQNVITTQVNPVFDFSVYTAGAYQILYLISDDEASFTVTNLNELSDCFAYSNPFIVIVQNKDEDGDGVQDCDDQELSSPCPDDVDADGVSNDDDGDGTPNCSDDCDNTIDTDNDGVADCIDQELGSPCPDDVDANGVSNDDDGDGTPNCTDDCDDTIDADNDDVADCVDQELGSPCPDDVDANGVSNDDDGDGTPNCTDDCDDTIDADNDGVADCVDQELGSPCPDDVDANGVSNDDDGDGTPNCSDDCDDTIDADNDGVADCVDQELDSTCPDDVDVNGVSNDDDGDGIANCTDDCDDTIDADNDGVTDCVDQELNSPCPNDVDANGVSNDDDGDGTPNCSDDCDDTIDADNDGVADCVDQELDSPCPDDVNASGVSNDDDGDGTPNCSDDCDDTIDADNDGVADCVDQELGSPCPDDVDANGVSNDDDGDGTPNCTDDCDDTIDADNDGVADCIDQELDSPCPNDVDENGVSNDDDGDGTPNCSDDCDDTIDADNDGVADCVDQELNSPCPDDVDANGVSNDVDGDGIANCEDNCNDAIDPGAITWADGSINLITCPAQVTIIESAVPDLPANTALLYQQGDNGAYIMVSSDYIGGPLNSDDVLGTATSVTFWYITMGDNFSMNDTELFGCYQLSDPITLISDTDSDGDGLCDNEDAEPNSPCPDDVDANGVSNDADADGIANCEDACPGLDDALLPLDPGAITFNDGSTVLNTCQGAGLTFSVVESEAPTLSEAATVVFINPDAGIFGNLTLGEELQSNTTLAGTYTIWYVTAGDNFNINGNGEFEGCYYLSNPITLTVEEQCNQAPVAVCQDITVYTGDDCQASISAAQLDGGSTDPDGDDLAFSINNEGPFAVGDQVLTLTVDDSELSSTCTATITVEDNTAPTATCQDVTIQLDDNGLASIIVSDINNGSNDACGLANISLDQDSFNCEAVGDNTVTLTVTDLNGNSEACNATVSVVDGVAPVAQCQDLTVQLDDNGQASMTVNDIDNGSSDICGIANLSLDKASFDCTNIGANTVTLTATDLNSNSSSCTATVTVIDGIAPIASCQDITVQLDDTGQVTVTPAQLDGGSTDNCGSPSFDLDNGQLMLTCQQIGDNPVTLSVIDDSDNASSCQATVTVVDDTKPTLTCPEDMTVNTDPGECGAYVTLPKAAPADNCGIKNLKSRYRTVDEQGNPAGSWSAWEGDHSGFFEPGAYQIQWRAKDDANNKGFCSYQLNIIDEEVPEVICTDVTINFNGEATIAIEASTIFDAVASFDACGTVTIASQSISELSCDQVGETLTVQVVGIDPNGNTSACTAQVTVEGMPCGFEAIDIDCPNGAAANYDPVAESFTLTANDCEGYPDGEYSAVMTELCGDGEIIAKVASLIGDGRAGVIMMESDEPGARFVSKVKDFTPRPRTEYRMTTGGSISNKRKNRSGVKWVRIVRQGNKFKTYTSINGSFWRLSHTITFSNFADCIQVGMLVYSKNADEPVTAVFENVTITGDSPSALEQITTDAASALQGIDAQQTQKDLGTGMDLNVAPNPFAIETQIEFTLPKASDVTLEIYNLHGQRVHSLENARLDAGNHRYEWDGQSSKGESLPTGIYMLRLRADKKWITTKVSLINR